MGTSQTANDIIRTFQAGESRGVAAAGTSGTSVAVAQTHTLLDGPRTDVADHTLLWLTARGAPRRIRDAMGGETVLTRGNSTFPSLVTEVRSPNARGDSLVLRSPAVYDARGRVSSSTVVDPLGDGASITTQYRYDDRWNLPDTIIPPVGGITAYVKSQETLLSTYAQEQESSSPRPLSTEPGIGRCGQGRA